MLRLVIEAQVSKSH